MSALYALSLLTGYKNVTREKKAAPTKVGELSQSD